MYEALGIINFESNNVNIMGLSEYRPVSAMSFAGRYRLIDFVLSNMTNSGIQKIQVQTRYGARQLFEHIGRGSQYNINPKRGNLRMLPIDKPFRNEIYNHDVAHLLDNIRFVEETSLPYVVIAPSYFIHRCNYEEVIKHHIENKNDITVVYHNTNEANEFFLECDIVTLDEEERITSFDKNVGKYKRKNISLETYVMETSFYLELVRKTAETSSLYWIKDMIRDICMDVKIGGWQQKNPVLCINSLRTYFQSNLKMINQSYASKFINPNWTIYTKTNDSSPTKYGCDTKVTHSLVSNGCQIDGTVENCVIGRNVVVSKGAIVKNCILLAGSFIGENAKLDHVIVDKSSIVNHVKKLVGSDSEPIYVKRGDRI